MTSLDSLLIISVRRADLATRLVPAGNVLASRGRQGWCTRKSHVPDTFQLGAISWYCAFLEGREINNLRVSNTRESPDSPRLHHFSRCLRPFMISRSTLPVEAIDRNVRGAGRLRFLRASFRFAIPFRASARTTLAWRRGAGPRRSTPGSL